MMPASLDHAMWFHRPFRADEWLLYAQDSPSAQDGRGLTRGMIFKQDGTLVASVAQEGRCASASESQILASASFAANYRLGSTARICVRRAQYQRTSAAPRESESGTYIRGKHQGPPQHFQSQLR